MKRKVHSHVKKKKNLHNDIADVEKTEKAQLLSRYQKDPTSCLWSLHEEEVFKGWVDSGNGSRKLAQVQ